MERAIKWPCLFLPALLLVGCSASSSSSLTGTWVLQSAQSLDEKLTKGDTSRPASNLPGSRSSEYLPSDMPDDVQAEIRGEAIPVTSSVRITFGADGTLKTSTRVGPIDSEKNGTWKVAGNDSSPQPAVVECTLLDQTSRLEIEWLDSETIKMTPPNMAGLTMKMLFRREK